MEYHNKRLLISIFLPCVFAHASGVQSTARAQTRPAEAAQVSVVEVRVTAVDGNGGAVRDLTEKDFTVKDNGQPVELTGFQLIEAGRPIGASTRPVKPEPIQLSRHFVFVMDLSFNDGAGLAAARAAALKFIHQDMLPDDDAAIFSMDVVDGVKMRVNFTRDRTQLVDALRDIYGTRGGTFLSESAGMVRIVPKARLRPLMGQWAQKGLDINQDEFYAVEQDFYLRDEKRNAATQFRGTVSTYLSSLENFSRSLDQMPGRKLVILFSHGFDMKAFGGETLREAAETAENFVNGDFIRMDTSTRDVDTRNLDLLENSAAHFSSSDCRIFCVDPSGGRESAERPETADASFRTYTALEKLASETGGQVFRHSNVLEKAMQDIEEASFSYYLMLYTAPTSRNGKYHKIDIDVDRSGVHLTHRKGYFEDKPFDQYSALDKQIQIAAILRGDTTPVRASVSTSARSFPTCGAAQSDANAADALLSRAVCAAEVPFNVMANAHVTPGDALECFFFAVESQRGEVIDYAYGMSKVPASPEEKSAGHEMVGGLRFLDTISLPPGQYRIVSILRDVSAGSCLAGSTSLVVEPPAGLSLSACIVAEKGAWTNVLSKRSAECYPLTFEGKQVVPRSSPILTNGEECLVLVKAYGVRRQDTPSGPDVFLGLLHADGTPIGGAGGKFLSGRWVGDGEYELAFKVHMPSKLDDGEYLIHVESYDRAHERKGIAQVGFTVKSRRS